MRRTVAVTLGLALLSLVAIQLIRPSIPFSTECSEVPAPVAATQVLRTSCYSCHSDERKLSWFDEIVPGYWLVRRDVLDARHHLNFSTLGAKPSSMQRAALFEAVNMAELGAMPLKSFTLLHPESRVNAAELGQLKDFLAPWRDLPANSPEPTQLLAPCVAGPSPSGLGFDPQFTSWHLISVTDRGDNASFRLILGNDIAAKAAQDGEVSPWPDGARFAKVAWKQRSTADGIILPGDFIQVELMIKDASAYRNSDGWGWGRWKGAALKPYGDNPEAVEECTGCHAPMGRNDFVYTMPISGHAGRGDRLNGRASLVPNLPFNPFTATPITMHVDRAQATISVLFRKSTGAKELLLITWAEQDDPHWFGARIPGEFVQAEYVYADSGESSPAYTRIAKDGSTNDQVGVLNGHDRARFIEQLSLAPYLTH